MTQYIVTYEKINNRLETETWFDQRPTHREVPALLVKAERIEAEAKRRVDEAWDEAERTGCNPWSALALINPSHGTTIRWLDDLRAYYNGDQGADCDHGPDDTCRYCRAMAAVSNYKFEEE